MTSPIIVLALIVVGFFVGNLLNYVVGILEFKDGKKRLFPGTSETVYNVLIGWFYFAALFSIPLSGNIPLFILAAGAFLYALYGSFGGENLKPSKQEDKATTKWFSGFP